MQASLTSDLARQRGSIIGAWLATHYDSDPLLQVLVVANGAWDAVADACERMRAYRATRLIPRWQTQAKSAESDSVPSLTIRSNGIWLGDVHLGDLLYLYRSVTPQETQARIAYETFIARFLRYLERTAQVLAFEPSESGVAIFVPERVRKPDKPDIPAHWKRFVQEAFSADGMRETLVLLLNSVRLSERGFSVPEVPVVSESEADVLAAFVYATARDIERRLARYERLIAAGGKGVEQLQQKLDKQRGNYSDALTKMKELMDALARREPDRAERIRALADAYTTEATSQLKSTRAIVAKFAQYIKKLLDVLPEQYQQISPLLTEIPPLPELHRPGDAAGQLCYACGRVLPKPKRVAMAPVYKANKFIFQAPSQTLQGYFAQTEPTVCGICAALAVACPIKPADDALVISLREPLNGTRDDGDERTYYRYEQQLRMLTTGELNVAAGRYLLLAAKERGPAGKLLKAQMGGYEYALFKVASLLPADVLEQFEAEAFLGASPRVVPQRQVVALRYLIEVFDTQPWALREDKATYGAVADAIRHVERDALNHAIYRLFSGSRRKARYGEVDLARLEQGREAFARGLKRMAEMDGATDEERRFRDVAGLTGVLYALVSRCDYEMRQRGVKDEDRARELKKLVEDVGNPNHFTYGAAAHLNGQSAQLWRTQQTWFAFDEARRLLDEVGVPSAQRETTDPNGRRLLQVHFDDVDAVYACLFAKRYHNKRDQRDFTYELKLSLYSRFPELVR